MIIELYIVLNDKFSLEFILHNDQGKKIKVVFGNYIKVEIGRDLIKIPFKIIKQSRWIILTIDLSTF